MSHASTPSIQHLAPDDDLQLLINLLPARLQERLNRPEARTDLIEIIMDLGRVPEARYPGRAVDLGEEPVSRGELDAVLSSLGFLSEDNRAGIERTLHRISVIRNRRGVPVGLTCRVGRAIYGTVEILRDVVESGKSLLLLGRPGVGKTTLLREAARVLADQLERRVIVVDTSNEIAGDGDIPHPGIGRARRMQVPSPARQHAVMIEAVENHMPEVIVIDEIGTEQEAYASRTIAERGVQLIATVHGNTLENLLLNPTLSDLVGGIQTVTLSDEEARRRNTRKTVLERRAPPTFEVVVELRGKDELAVHHDVAGVVDRLLRGQPSPPEVRVRQPDGQVQRLEASAAGPSHDQQARHVLHVLGGMLGPEPSPRRARGERRERGSTDSRRAPPRPLEPTHEPPPIPHRADRTVRIFPYAISWEKLERAIEHVGADALVTTDLRQADLVLTMKAQIRRNPQKLREALHRGLPLEQVRSNTVAQMEAFLEAAVGARGRTARRESRESRGPIEAWIDDEG